MEIFVTVFTQFITWFQQLGPLAYSIIFVIAFLDSLIVAGSFMNATAFLLLAGVMVSQGTHDFAAMALFASLGAIIGGVCSFQLGTAGVRWFKSDRPATANDHHNAGTQLLEQYGGFGVFVGRFLGPVSSMVAFIAGTTGLPWRSFALWNVLSGLSWGVGYVTIGSMFGSSVSMFQNFL